MDDLYQKQFHFTRLTLQEKILENIPCIFIKGTLLYKTLNNHSEGEFKYFTFSNVTTLISIVTLILAINSFENVCQIASGLAYAGSGKSSQLISFFDFIM